MNSSSARNRSVLVVLTPDPERDAAHVDLLANRLRSEFNELELEAIDAVQGRSEVPPGSKGPEVFEVGAWLLTLSASGGVLVNLIQLARDWLNRNRGNNKLTLTIAGDSIELDNVSTSERSELIAAFIARHHAGDRDHE